MAGPLHRLEGGKRIREARVRTGAERAEASPEPSLLPVISALGQLHELVALVASGSGEVLWASGGLSRLCGADGAAGRHWLDAFAPTADPALRAHFAEARSIADAPIALRDAGGRRVAARISTARIASGKGCEATAVVFRLEAGSGASHELRHRIDTLAAILDGAPDGVAVVDHARCVRWANRALAEMTGWAVEDLVDRPLATLLRSPEQLERIATELRPGAPAWSEEIETRRRDGRPLVVNVHARLLTLDDGSELGAVAYVRDVTERRRLDEELARRAEELQHWVNAVSHDLRSPLVAVLGFARLLREDYGEQLDAQGLRFLRRIEEAGRTMESLVHDLLEFARIGRSEPKRVHVDPCEVLHQLQAELKPRLEEAQVSLQLPEDPPLLWCDRTQLYQVLSNLVGNALDHMGPASRPRIEVAISEHDGLQELVVRDHGRGVDAADHERIFEIFQTRGGSRGGRRGTGIGLAVVRKIAQAHGGSAWVESEPGRGAAFHVTFRNA